MVTVHGLVGTAAIPRVAAHTTRAHTNVFDHFPGPPPIFYRRIAPGLSRDDVKKPPARHAARAFPTGGLVQAHMPTGSSIDHSITDNPKMLTMLQMPSDPKKRTDPVLIIHSDSVRLSQEL